MAYRIYPENRLRARICTPHGKIQEQAVIVQNIRAGPFVLSAAVRVTRVIDEAGRFAFRYYTLEGHPELGTASFLLESHGSGITVRIESWSQPGHWLVRVLHLFLRRMQKQASRAALARISAVVEYGADRGP